MRRDPVAWRRRWLAGEKVLWQVGYVRERESSNPILLAGPGTVPELRRLGRNFNGYQGERIDIDAVLADCRSLARESGWSVEELDPEAVLSLPAFHCAATQPALSVYISAGIHGDEPAGPLAIRQMFLENRWPSDMDLRICPCLNPTGFRENRRENVDGMDLNRQYLRPHAREIIAHIAWLERQPRFDLCLCLHEDWESEGFYLYELNPDRLPSASERIIADVAKSCPVDLCEVIDGRKACQGIIRPEADLLLRPDWPEAFFLLMHKTRLSYTLEAPSDYPLPVRVSALVTAVQSALKEHRGAGG